MPTNYSHTYGIRDRSNHFLTCKPMGNHGYWDFRTITWVWNFTRNFTGIVKVYECNFDQSDGWIS